MPLTRLDTFLIGYSDSAFTNPHEVAQPDLPEDRAGRFTHMGAQYWGFETRRHIGTQIQIAEHSFRFDPEAHHHFTLGLHSRSEVSKIDVDTTWFTGNQVPEISIFLEDGAQSTEVVPRTSLAPNQQHSFAITPTFASRCLVLCHQEGGIARVQLFGQTQSKPRERNLLEEATISFVSNAHYGHPKDAVLGRRIESHMKGWESARTGFGEQAVFTFKAAVRLQRFVVDTYLHRLNAPLSCHLFGLVESEDLDHGMAVKPRWAVRLDDNSLEMPEDFQDYMNHQRYRTNGKASQPMTISLHNPAPETWVPLLPFAPLRPDHYHEFEQFDNSPPVKHLLFMYYPNGGIHGLKAHGVYQT